MVRITPGVTGNEKGAHFSIQTLSYMLSCMLTYDIYVSYMGKLLNRFLLPFLD